VLLAKVLGMTASDKDGEALNAIRKANEMVKEAGMAWDDVLVQVPPGRTFTVTVSRETGINEATAHLKDKKTLDLMFAMVFAQPRSGNDEYWEKMDRLYNVYQTYGSIAPGDYKVLKAIYLKLSKHPG